MNESILSINQAFDSLLDRAIELGGLGYRVFPLKPNRKEPMINDWPNQASADEDTIRGWFDNDRGLNLGLACGPQPNGLDIVAIDIDNHGKDGRATWTALIDAYGDSQVRITPRHKTPNDGFHLLFDVPTTLHNSRDGLGEGIDTRGAGGYIVLPPSRIMDNDGVFRHYTAPQPLWSTDVMAMPTWMHRLLTAPEPQPAPRQAGDWRPSGGNAESSPFDWARENHEWEQELVRAGWRYVKEFKNDSYWARPGKDDRGHSAVLHNSGAFVVFSTEVPSILEDLGRKTPDGSGFTVSLPDFLVAYRFNGDRRAATQAWGQQMRAAGSPHNPLPSSAAPTEAAEPHASTGLADGAAAAGTAAAAYFLPASFWAQRPWLQHIRQAAESKMVSPDALLVAFLARWATLVPACYRLPDAVGDFGTFDFMGVIVAESGGGKSAANGIAKRLLPNPHLNVEHPEDSYTQMDLGAGTGEGLIQSFFVPEVDPESNKPTGKQKVGKYAIHFTVDEGTALLNQAKREGSTILQVLCSAWSGSNLGQANAAADKRRIIEGGRVRVSAVINMQSSNGYKLFEEEITAIGFASRAVFASAHQTNSPDLDDLPDWPGQISVPSMRVINGAISVIDYDPRITREVRQGRLGQLRTEAPMDPHQTHRTLSRCKVAGLVALLEDRRTVSMDDWALAGQIMSSSEAMISHLRGLRQERLHAARKAATAIEAERVVDIDNAKEVAAVERVTARINAIMTAPGAPTSRGYLRRSLAGRDRQYFEAALATTSWEFPDE